MDNQEEYAPTVLVVDDTMTNLYLVANALETQGHHVVVARDGTEALRRATQVSPDLILLDVMMPNVDGYEVCRRLKADPATRDVPVIFMTALSEQEERLEGFRAGAVDYVTKPIHLEELLVRVNTHLRIRAMQKQLQTQNERLRVFQEDQERVLAERTEELQLRTYALDQVHEAAYVLDENARILYVNQAACRALGYTAEELIAMTVMDIDRSVDAVRWNRLWAETGSRGALTIDTHHTHRDGRQIPVEISATRFAFQDKCYSLSLARDISERKEAEIRLHASEQAFRAVVERSPDVIVRFNREGRRIYVNPEAVRRAGRPAEALLGSSPADEAMNVNPSEFLARLRGVIDTGQESTLEVLLKEPVGEPRWCDVRLVPEKDADGNVVSVLSITRDIDAIKRREQQFRALAETFPDSVARFDSDGRYTYINPSAELMFARSLLQVLGKTPREFPPYCDTQQSEAMVASIRHVFETGGSEMHEVALMTTAGQRVFEMRHVPEKDAAGNVVAVVGIGRDITQLRAVEMALRQSEYEFRTLAENLPDVIVRYDRQCRRTYLNQQFERVMGLPAHAALGKSPEELPAEVRSRADTEVFMRELRAVLDSGVRAEIEMSLTRGTRHTYWNIRAIPEFDGDCQLTGVFTIWHDITAHKESERRLRESYDLLKELTSRRENAREEERRRVAREVHDELGQLLTALRMGVSSMRVEFGRDNPDLVQRVQEMMSLADQTLLVVRNVTASLRPPALDSGIEAGVEWLAAEFQRHSGVRCRVSLPKSKIIIGEAGSIALLRITQESLTNIARHAAAKQVNIILKKKGNDCLLQVRDDGLGFDAAAVPRRSFGLVGMQERAVMVGGQIGITSRPGRGTTIKARIPINEVVENT